MKKIFLTILLLFVSLNIVYSQNTMRIDTLSGKPGDTLTYSVKIDNIKSFVAYQLDVQIPAYLTYVNNSAALTGRANAHNLGVSLINSTTLRVLAYSLTMNPFLGNTGAVLTFKCNVTGNVPGTYSLNVVTPVIADSLNVNILTASYNGRFILLMPKIAFSTSAMNFGTTLLGTNKDLSLTIYNQGTSNLTISKITSNSGDIRFLDSSGFTLAAGTNLSRTVRLYANTRGVKNAGFVFYSNDPSDSVHTVTATGTVFTTNELYLNTVTSKYGFVGTMKIRMKNFESVSAFQTSITLPASINYVAGSVILNPARTNDHIITASVLSGNILKIISYSPTNKPYLSNDSTIAQFSYIARGNPGSYSIPITEGIISDTNGVNILSNVYAGSISVISPVIGLPASILFDTISYTDTSRKVLTIQNTGNDTLLISGINATESSFANETTLPVKIPPSSTRNFTIRFTNSVNGLHTGNLIVSHNDSLRNPGSVAVSGFIYKPTRLKVTSSDFNSRDSSYLPFSITNKLPIVAFQFDVTLPAQFSYIPNSAILTSRANGHQVYTSTLGNGDIRVIAYSMSQNKFNGDSGDVVKLRLVANADTGVYNVTVKNVIISDSNNVNVSTGFDNGFIRLSPYPPALISPLNGSVGNEANLNLYWSKSLFASYYHLQVATDSLFTNKIVNDSTRTDTTYALSNLSILQNYYWRVRVKNYSGIYRFSDKWKFKIIGYPTQVVLSLPANNAVNQTLNPVFKWFKALDQTLSPDAVSKYWFECSTDSLFTNIIETDTTLTDTTKTLTGITDLTKYFWRVKAKNIFGWGSFSNIWNFTTGDYSGQWVQASGGIGLNKAIQSFAVIGNKMFTGTYGNSPGVFVSTNKGASWTSVSNGLPPNPSVFSICAFGNNLFVGTIGNGGYISTNFGNNWTQVTNGLSDPKILTTAYNGTTLFAGTYDNGVFRSTDNGASWSNCLTANRDYAMTVKDNYVFVGTISGSVYRSSNNGVSWTSCSSGTSGEKFELYGSGENLYLGTRPNGVFRSTNNGDSWTQKNSGLTNTTVYALASIGSNVFAGTPSGAFLSTNYGESWVQINQGFTATPEIDEYYFYDDYIFAGTGGYSAWRRALSTLIVPDAPTLMSPANLTTGNPLNINLVWNKSKYATKYNLILASDSLFTTIVLNDSLLTDSVKIISNLTPLTKYYWKVKSGNSAGWGPFSNAYNFKTIGSPTQVTLSSPSNGAIDIIQPVQFYWYEAFDLTLAKGIKGNEGKGGDSPLTVSNYWFEYGTDSTFTSVLTRDSTLTDTTKYISGLSYITKYYWRVKAKNQTGWGAFSSVWNFTTMPNTPNPPTLLTPANNSVDLSLTPVLDWNDVQYAVSYRVLVSSSNTFGYAEFDTNGLSVSTITIPAGKLTTNTKYYWKVVAQNSAGSGLWSSVWNFTTVPNVPNVPILSLPANNATGQPTSITFKWFKAIETILDNKLIKNKIEAGDSPDVISKYWIEYGTDSTFSTVTGRDSTLTDTTKSVTALNTGTSYYWRVKAKNQTGWGGFSSIFKFTTLIPTLSLNLKVYLEGFWDGSAHVSDTVMVYLANATTPFAYADTAKVILSGTGTASMNFNRVTTGSYYIVVNHRNHLETWSKLPQSFVGGTPLSYDFTTAMTQAYGDNLKQVGSAWVLFGGDANRDGSIDALDVIFVVNQFGTQGYLQADFNGDQDVTGMDVALFVPNFGMTKIIPSVVLNPIEPKIKTKDYDMTRIDSRQKGHETKKQNNIQDNSVKKTEAGKKKNN